MLAKTEYTARGSAPVRMYHLRKSQRRILASLEARARTVTDAVAQLIEGLSRGGHGAAATNRITCPAAGIGCTPRPSGQRGTLQVLCLRGNCFGDSQLAVLMAAVCRSRTLTTLEYVVYTCMAHRCPTSASLLVGRLDHNHVTDSGAAVIARTITSGNGIDVPFVHSIPPSLTSLCLHGHLMGSRGVREIAVAVSRATTISSMDLSCGDPDVAGSGVNVPGLVLEEDGTLAGGPVSDAHTARDTSAPPEFLSWFRMTGSVTGTEVVPDSTECAGPGSVCSDSSRAHLQHVPGARSDGRSMLRAGAWEGEEEKGVEGSVDIESAGGDSVAGASSSSGGDGMGAMYQQQRASTISALQARRRSITGTSSAEGQADDVPNAIAAAAAALANMTRRQPYPLELMAQPEDEQVATVAVEAPESGRSLQDEGITVVSRYADVAALLDSLQMGGWRPRRKHPTDDYAARWAEELVDNRSGIGQLGVEGVYEMMAFGAVTRLR